MHKSTRLSSKIMTSAFSIPGVTGGYKLGVCGFELLNTDEMLLLLEGGLISEEAGLGAADLNGVEGGQEAGDVIEGLGLKIEGLEAGLLSLEH